MDRPSRRRKPSSRSSANRADAERQGAIDGEEWAKKQAHPSELRLIGLQFEVNRRRGYASAFRRRGSYPGPVEFMTLIRPNLDGDELRDEAKTFWGDRLEVIKSFGRFGFHYLKEFALP